MIDRLKHIAEYYTKINSAKKELTKKEAFKDLLNRLYAGSEDIKAIIDKISLGAETTVLNIPRKDGFHLGSADTLYNNIIIEFENDLRKTFKHAKSQLAGYMLGCLNSGEDYSYVMIASDFIHWKILAPDISCIDKLETLTEEELILNEVETASFTLNEENYDEFYFWLDRFLFKETKQKATLKNVEESFGQYSRVFIESFRILDKHYQDAKKYGDVQVAFEEWNKFLSIAYGTFEGTDEFFMIHTYLSIFSKILAFSVVTNDDFISDKSIAGILDGKAFANKNIHNFVEHDFYNWVMKERIFVRLGRVFRLISQELSTYNFDSVDEDILKGVYQELIDIETRHSLGEYYTPDWLCERIVSEFDFKINSKIIDPSCGSGSFLRAAVHRYKELHPDISPQKICENIYGIDIHPLSVQIAKTTVLISLGERAKFISEPIKINIILANTLLAPEGETDLFGSEFQITIDKFKYQINTQVLESVNQYDAILMICDNLAEQTKKNDELSISEFEKILDRQYTKNGITSQITESYHRIYQGFRKAKIAGRNGIWKFILSNIYKPYFFAGRFDYVVGNPPWFTFSSVKNEEYQNILNQLADKYNVKPERTANFPHLEIASIFMAHSNSYFLKEGGNLAFVLPRSFFNADHHDNTRSGKIDNFMLNEIWDLESVTPLFNIPSCVFFAEKSNKSEKISSRGIKAITFKGRVPYHNCHYITAKTKLTETKNRLYYIRQGKSTAFSVRKAKTVSKHNPYKNLFRQGATIVPRSFYFVDVYSDSPLNKDTMVINVVTSKSVKNDAKAPWKGLNVAGYIETKCLYRTAISKSILPFVLHNPSLVILPVTVQQNENGKKELKVHTALELMFEGHQFTSKLMHTSQTMWELKRTERNKKHTLSKYLNWQNKLTSQNLNVPYLVLYTASAKDAIATVVVRDEHDYEFIAESKTYWFGTNDINEAYYLTAILNSNAINLLIKDFQTRGLFGPRDIHKKILDVYFPKYNESEPLHKIIAELGFKASKSAKEYLQNLNISLYELPPSRLGKIRTEIKMHLKNTLLEIDISIKKLLNI